MVTPTLLAAGPARSMETGPPYPKSGTSVLLLSGCASGTGFALQGLSEPIVGPPPEPRAIVLVGIRTAAAGAHPDVYVGAGRREEDVTRGNSSSGTSPPSGAAVGLCTWSLAPGPRLVISCVPSCTERGLQNYPNG